MTWVGAPTIYYGDEAGLVGFTDPDNRRTYPWGREDQDLIAFHKAIIKIRKDHPQLRTGSLKRVGDDFNILAYGRFDQNGQCLVVINNNEEPRYQELSVWELNIPKEATMVSELRSDEHGFSLEKRAYEVSMGRVKITMPPLSAAIFTLQRTP
jgi:alpha-glucosidase